MDEFERGIDSAQKKFKSFSENIKSVSDGISKSYSGLKDLLSPAVDGFKAVEGVGKKAGNAITTGLKGFAAAATAVGGFGTAAVKSGMAFDSSMSAVAAISGATGDEFDALRNKALEMGAKTKFSASEAADAMTYMGMAGWKTEDMLNGIAGIMNLAAASGEDLASTSDIVTNALTAFGMSASESGHFADILASASSNANTDVHMMGESFKYAAPVMGTLGYSAEDTAVALGLMGNAGIQASMAGTSLKTAMLNMASPTKAMAGVMSQYGISLTDTNGEMYSLGEVMAQLRDKMGGLDETTKAAAASTLFGKEAAAGMLAIINAAPEDFEKLTTAINECNGAAEKMSSIMEDNLQGDITKLGSAFESLQIAISDSLTPTLREFAQFGQKAMAGLLEGFQGSGVSGFMSALSGIVTDGVKMLSEKAPEFAGVSLNFIQALAKGILDAKNEIAQAAGLIITGMVEQLDSFLEKNSTNLTELGLNLVDRIFWGFTKAGEIISQYIGQFIPLIAETFLSYHESLFTIGLDILGAIGQGIIDNKEEIGNIASETITNMVTSLRDNAPMIIDGGLALLEALAGTIVENLPLIMETGAEIIGQLVAGISTASPAVQAIIGTAVLPHIMKIIDVVGGIGQAFGGVVQLVSGGISTIMGIGSKLMGGIQALFSLIMAHPVVAVVTAIVAAVVLLWQNCEAFRDAVGAIWDAIVGFFQAAAEGIKAAFDGIVDFFRGIWDGIQSIFSTVAEVLSGFFRAAAEAVQAAWDAVVSFFSGVWDGIQGVFSNVADVLGGFFKSAWEIVQGAWEAAKEFFIGIAEGIHSAFETVTQFLGDAFSTAWDLIQGVWDTAVGFFQGIWDGISGAFSAVAEWFGEKFSAARSAVEFAWDNITDFFSGIWEDICNVFGNVWDKFKEIGGNMLSGLWEGVTGAFGWVKEKIGGVVDGIVGVFTGKDGFDTHSPSKVMEEIGKNVILGLGEGVEGENGSIDGSVKNIVSTMKDAFTGLAGYFTDIGKNAMSSLASAMSAGISALQQKVSALMSSIAEAAKAALGIHSPSRVFAGIGENMALGLAEGWDDEYNAIRRKIEGGLNFGTATVGVTGNYSGAQGSAGSSGKPGFGGDFVVNIYNPEKRDPVTEAREWKKTMQRAAMDYA